MAENPRHTKIAELHQRSVDLWLDGKRTDAIAMYRQALGLETDAISLQLRDTLPNSYSDPDATPNAPINLQQQNAFAAYRNTIRLTVEADPNFGEAWHNLGVASCGKAPSCGRVKSTLRSQGDQPRCGIQAEQPDGRAIAAQPA